MGEYLKSSYQLSKVPLQHQEKKADLKPQYAINVPASMWHKPDKYSNVFLNDVRVHYNLEEQDSEINGQLGILQCKRKKKQSEKRKEKQPEKRKKEPMVFAPPEYEDGAQGNVQELVAYLYRETRGIQNNGDIGEDPERIWLNDIVSNGLCGGWAALHRAAPQKFVRVWTALAKWNQEDDLAEHMNSICSVQEPDMGWEDYIISLTNSAVSVMKELEPDAGYQVLPDDKADELPEFVLDRIPKNPDKTKNVKVGDEGAGTLIYNTMLSEPCLKKKPGIRYIIHIETNQHHMSVQTRYVNRKIHVEEIVEPEYVGVVQSPDPVSAMRILEHGTYLPPAAQERRSEEDLSYRAQEVSLNYYRLDKRNSI